MSEAKHTPLPWCESRSDILKRNGTEIALLATCHQSPGKMENGEREANAAYIVKACNEYADLVEAARAALAYMEDDSRSPRRREANMIELRRIIAKAEQT